MIDSFRGFLFFGALFFSLFLGKQTVELTEITFLGGVVAALGISCAAIFIGGPGFVRFDLNPFPVREAYK